MMMVTIPTCGRILRVGRGGAGCSGIEDDVCCNRHPIGGRGQWYYKWMHQVSSCGRGAKGGGGVKGIPFNGLNPRGERRGMMA